MRVCVFSCVPAGGLGMNTGELTLSVDAEVFVVIWTGDVQAAGESIPQVLFISYCEDMPTRRRRHTLMQNIQVLVASSAAAIMQYKAGDYLDNNGTDK